jgi:phage-related minor tail protein
MSVKKRTAIHRNIQRRSVINPETTIRDALLILRAAIRVTLTTTLSNISLLIKEIKTIIWTLKPIYKTLMTLRAILKNLMIVLPISLFLKHLLWRK